MSILIIGSEGSMGKRYQSILGYLKVDRACVDKEAEPVLVKQMARYADGIIIASPTDTHLDYIRMLAPFKKPILCEKPVHKNVPALKDVLKELRSEQCPFRMMYQYKVLASPLRIGASFYNYFKHGQDGLIWDCMQIIGLARGKVELYEDSPVWSCKLNGQRLNSAHMDAAYIHYLKNWLNDPDQDHGEILAVHERTAEAERMQAIGKPN